MRAFMMPVSSVFLPNCASFHIPPTLVDEVLFASPEQPFYVSLLGLAFSLSAPIRRPSNVLSVPCHVVMWHFGIDAKGCMSVVNAMSGSI